MSASSAVVDRLGQASEVDAEPFAERAPGRLPEVAIEERADLRLVEVRRAGSDASRRQLRARLLGDEQHGGPATTSLLADDLEVADELVAQREPVGRAREG